MTGLLDHEEVFERVTFLLAAVIFLLVLWVLRTLDGPFSPIMKKREEGAEASVGDIVNSRPNRQRYELAAALGRPRPDSTRDAADESIYSHSIGTSQRAVLAALE